MSVLILSRRENLHADVVEKSLKRRGVEMLRVDMEDINSKPPRVSVTHSSLMLKGRKINPELITGVFVHHPRVEVSEKIGTDQIDRKIMASSWSIFISSLESILDKSRWVNRTSTSGSSSDVFKQLKLARKIGFVVPETIFSNDINSVLGFASKFGEVILKPGPLIGVPIRGRRILTHVVDVGQITAGELVHSPCFFQEYINKKFELRIHVIGDRVLACKIDSQRSKRANVDWRRYDIANTPHYTYELGKWEEKKCIELTRKLGLEMGVIDAIVTPGNEFVFLECNSNGYWIWIEELTGLPITETVVDHLTTPL